MVQQAQHLQSQRWQIHSVRVRVRDGPDRLRQVYRLLLHLDQQRLQPYSADKGQRPQLQAGGE